MVVTRAPIPVAGATSCFAATAPQQTSLRDLATLFTHAVSRFGVAAYAVGLIHTDGQPNIIYLTTWPRAWVELYAANGFIADDPLVAEAIENPEPFSWGEMKARRGITANRVIDAAARFGWRDGFAVPVHGPGEALALVARGLDDAAIGDALGVTRASAHMYVERAKRRLGAGTRAQAVATALAEGWL